MANAATWDEHYQGLGINPTTIGGRRHTRWEIAVITEITNQPGRRVGALPAPTRGKAAAHASPVWPPTAAGRPAGSLLDRSPASARGWERRGGSCTCTHAGPTNGADRVGAQVGCAPLLPAATGVPTAKCQRRSVEIPSPCPHYPQATNVRSGDLCIRRRPTLISLYPIRLTGCCMLSPES